MTTGQWVKALSLMLLAYAGAMLVCGVMVWEMSTRGVLPEWAGRGLGLIALGVVEGGLGAVGVWRQWRTPLNARMQPQSARAGIAWSLIMIGLFWLMAGPAGWILDPRGLGGPVFTFMGIVWGLFGLWGVRADLRA